MNLTFESLREYVWPDDDISLSFWVENPTGRRLPCAYRLEGSDAEIVGWRVDAPTSLAAGKRARGELRVRAPRNNGTEPLTLTLRLVVSTDDPGVRAQVTCTLVVRAARVAAHSVAAPSPNGTLADGVLSLERGLSKARPRVTSRNESSRRLYAERPTVTVHSSSRRMRLLRPTARWSAPRINLNPDGTVTVKMSLVNHGDLDVSASIRLRHSDGWWLVPEDPQLTIAAHHGPVDVSATFRPSPGHHVGSSDELSVEVQVNGVPVADATAAVRPVPASFAQLVALGAAAAIIATAGTATAVERSSHEATAAVPVQACNVSTKSGGEGTTKNSHELGRRGPTSFLFQYETQNVADEIIIRYQDTEVFRVGPVATRGWTDTIVNVPAGSSTLVEVTVTGSRSGTFWEYKVNCPNGG